MGRSALKNGAKMKTNENKKEREREGQDRDIREYGSRELEKKGGLRGGWVRG